MVQIKKYNNLNGIALAYVGDAVYDLYIRQFLIERGKTRPNDLHQTAIHYVSAKAQANLVALMKEEKILTVAEEKIFLRGRNAKAHTKAKNTSWATYSKSTGFEAVIGFLYLTEQKERLDQLISWCVEKIINKNDKN